MFNRNTKIYLDYTHFGRLVSGNVGQKCSNLEVSFYQPILIYILRKIHGWLKNKPYYTQWVYNLSMLNSSFIKNLPRFELESN